MLYALPSGLRSGGGRRRVERKGGLIPIDGRAGEMYNKHILLLGDAAGLCGAAAGGGIFQAMASGQLAADYVMGNYSPLL